MIFISDIYTND